MKQHDRFAPWARIAMAAAALGALTACQTSRVETAQQLMRDQQREQALAQEKADESMRRNAATPPEVALSLIRESQRDGRYFASLAYIDAYRQSYGEGGEVAALRADALRMTGQPAAAEQAYRALLNGDQAARGWHGLGLLAGAQNNFEDAADKLGRAARMRPTDPQYLGDLGYALLRAGDPAAARVPLGQAAELDPGNARIIGNLALLLLVSGDALAAHQVMDQAGLSEPARERVVQLADEVRQAQRQSAVAPPQAIAAVSMVPGRDRPGRDGPGRDRPGRDRPGGDATGADAARADAARPSVRQVDASGRAVADASSSAASPVSAAMPMPVLQRPLLDRMGNPAAGAATP
ncbi:tetratricopeptide repeat protein [Bordetella genomosp. 5]|uniref:tetratricopeptide repeat protein n=1 Tax=Bordetella genomosp. 5 TaxID=1395608 RepID=UPI000B9EC678|nr:tetratricopeptide repeat protein [Bordetella genomosp. 5]